MESFEVRCRNPPIKQPSEVMKKIFHIQKFPKLVFYKNHSYICSPFIKKIT